MRYTVREEFVTPLHRFPAGAEIDENEVDGPLSVEEWVARGMLVSAEPAGEMAERVEGDHPEAAQGHLDEPAPGEHDPA